MAHDSAILDTRFQRFLTSKTGHYSVLLLVSLDVSYFITQIFRCERKHLGPEWETALNALGMVSLVFSCLFMIKLVASIWASAASRRPDQSCFSYFNSYFHVFDAIVIIAGFTIDVLLHGVLEEVASLLVILRLWRVFKIIEELSVGAEEQMETLQERIEMLEKENRNLKGELRVLKRRCV
ncbi:hypothetical protein B0A49_04873 [Cryomyces minteri]|uniref:Uncharacterized protein n=1 Tax=Cryomyces minteri TaxID=331657 RepID=A0A4U0WQC6_9PEZI|nr:hypothetical protein B0A49_04873 [Cryomyces minteri]